MPPSDRAVEGVYQQYCPGEDSRPCTAASTARPGLGERGQRGRRRSPLVGPPTPSPQLMTQSTRTPALVLAPEDRGRGSRGADGGGGGERCAARHGCSGVGTSLLLLCPSRWIHARQRMMTRSNRSTTAVGRRTQLASSPTMTAAMPIDAGCGLPLGSSGPDASAHSV
jgi:hypothetical protein